MPERKWAACLYAVPNLPLVGEGDDLAGLIHASATGDGFAFEDGDVVVVAQRLSARLTVQRSG